MNDKTLKIGIMPFKDYKRYTMAIANGRHKPEPGEPRIWFNSIETMSQVLSSRNLELLKLIQRENPGSIKELAELSGRKMSNLSRTLKTFSRYGLVELVDTGTRARKPVARVTQFEIELGKDYPLLPLVTSNEPTCAVDGQDA